MAWETDIVEACYTAPSGKKFYFAYDSKLTSEVDLKTATFTFPERDGALVVPLGIGGRRFSFTCFFYGRRSKKEADDFEAGLKERGYGELQHPLYGTFKVVPTGTISRSDDVVSGVGVSSVGITFAETIIDVSTINSEVVVNDEIDAAVEEFERKSILEFCRNIVKSTIKGITKITNAYKTATRAAAESLRRIAQAEKSIYTKFQTIESELFSSIDSIINAAESVAIQTNKLFNLPSRAAADVAAKIEGYGQAVKDIIRQFRNSPARAEDARNQWVSARLMLESLVVSCASGVATTGNNKFRSREEAVGAAMSILSIYDSVVEFEEKNVDKDYFVEVGEGFSAMRDVVSMSVAQIVDNSFSLPTKKSIVLGKDRQIVELLFDLYGGLEKIDEFIVDNNLNYNEIEVIPMGREVAYYV